MRDLGSDPFINTPEQFGELMRTDMARYAEVIKKANLKMN
jgi:tripartite-type tricarboxylate transporter receptor subunit TctC